MEIIEEPRSPLRALRIAMDRDLLPTHLGSQELREVSREIRRAAVFSARTTSAEYLQEVRAVVGAIAEGELDKGEARVILRDLLDALGYTPESGFSDDEPGVIPPAVEGTLQDLRSRQRLDLVLDTQVAQMRGAAQNERALDRSRMHAWPAFELVYAELPETPRNWIERWKRAGGTPTEDGRLMAMKRDRIWSRVGSSEFFKDALDTTHPPFAYNSHRVLRETARATAIAAIGDRYVDITGKSRSIDDQAPLKGEGVGDRMPKPEVLNKADRDLIEALGAELDEVEANEGVLTLDIILGKGAN